MVERHKSFFGKLGALFKDRVPSFGVDFFKTCALVVVVRVKDLGFAKGDVRRGGVESEWSEMGQDSRTNQLVQCSRRQTG